MSFCTKLCVCASATAPQHKAQQYMPRQGHTIICSISASAGYRVHKATSRNAVRCHWSETCRGLVCQVSVRHFNRLGRPEWDM